MSDKSISDLQRENAELRKELEQLRAQPARQVGGDSPEWSDAQVHDFLSVALRHVEVEGTLNFQDIRDAMRYMLGKS